MPPAVSLLPCPFCGSRDVAVDGFGFWHDLAVLCATCGARGPMTQPRGSKRVRVFFGTKPVSEAWNHRVTFEPARAEAKAEAKTGGE